MKAIRSKNILVFLMMAFLLSTAVPIGSSAAASYPMTNAIRADIESIVNESMAEGRRIAAVVRLYNLGTQVARVPDYEVRAVTSDKIQYALRPSRSNAIAIQPKETVEVRYMIVVRRFDDFTVTKLTWTKLNKTVYPRKEETVLSIPVTQNRQDVKDWGQFFKISPDDSVILYKPVSLMKQNIPQGPAMVLTIQAFNPGTSRQFIPEFLVEGKSDAKVYQARRLDPEPTALEPGQQESIPYVIRLDHKAKLRSLNILTTETFLESDQKAAAYRVGWVTIRIPADLNGAPDIESLAPQAWDAPIPFHPDNKLIHPDLEISLSGFAVERTAGGESNRAVAEFALVNRGFQPLPVPEFAAEIVGRDGRRYLGTRLKSPSDTMGPDLRYSVSYSFEVPLSENGEKLGMILSDGQTLAPFRIPIASFGTRFQTQSP